MHLLQKVEDKEIDHVIEYHNHIQVISVDFQSDDDGWSRSVKHFEDVYKQLKNVQKKQKIDDITEKNFAVAWQCQIPCLHVKVLDQEEEFEPQFACRCEYQDTSILGCESS